MKKTLVLLSCLCLGSIGSLVNAFQPDNRLLNTLYDKIDAVYATAPDRVLYAYEHLTIAKIRAAKKPELLYYLEKIEIYLHGKLFTFTEQPNFVCLDTYVQKNDTVEIDYTVKNNSGQVLTTTLESVAQEMWIPLSQVANRLAFNPWNDQVLPGMDKLVLGAKLNKRTAALLEPKDAYGVYTEAKIVQFSGKLPPELQVADVGGRVMMQVTIDEEPYLLIGTVKEKTATWARVDFNHPHAGETILLSLEVMNLFKACR